MVTTLYNLTHILFVVRGILAYIINYKNKQTKHTNSFLSTSIKHSEQKRAVSGLLPVPYHLRTELRHVVVAMHAVWRRQRCVNVESGSNSMTLTINSVQRRIYKETKDVVLRLKWRILLSNQLYLFRPK